MQNIKTPFAEYAIYTFRGKVAGTSKNMETKVHGSGGGGYSYQGTGYSQPVNIRSTTTIHDQFFLIDETGQERSFQLQDFNIACREGNELAVFWAIKKGKSEGPYFAVHNYSTADTFFNHANLVKIFRAPLLYLLGAMLLLWIIMGLKGFVLAILLLIAWFVHGNMQAKKFKTEFQNSYGDLKMG